MWISGSFLWHFGALALLALLALWRFGNKMTITSTIVNQKYIQPHVEKLFLTVHLFDISTSVIGPVGQSLQSKEDAIKWAWGYKRAAPARLGSVRLYIFTRQHLLAWCSNNKTPTGISCENSKWTPFFPAKSPLVSPWLGHTTLTLMMLGKVKIDLAIFDGKILQKLYYVRRLIFQPCLPKDLIIWLNPPFPQKNYPNFNILSF